MCVERRIRCAGPSTKPKYRPPGCRKHRVIGHIRCQYDNCKVQTDPDFQNSSYVYEAQPEKWKCAVCESVEAQRKARIGSVYSESMKNVWKNRRAQHKKAGLPPPKPTDALPYDSTVDLLVAQPEGRRPESVDTMEARPLPGFREFIGGTSASARVQAEDKSAPQGQDPLFDMFSVTTRDEVPQFLRRSTNTATPILAPSQGRRLQLLSEPTRASFQPSAGKKSQGGRQQLRSEQTRDSHRIVPTRTLPNPRVLPPPRRQPPTSWDPGYQSMGGESSDSMEPALREDMDVRMSHSRLNQHPRDREEREGQDTF